MNVEILRRICHIVDGNMREARKYAECAHKYKSHHRDYADWCVSMAKMHLSANTEGFTLADKMAKEISDADAILGPGVKAMYADYREGWAPETAEIKMMIEMYSR